MGKRKSEPRGPERTRRQRGPTESVALNMPCAHIRSRRSWLRAYALALICRPSASSAAPQALQGSISFSCVTGGSHLRLRLDEPPPAICLSSSGLSNSARCARGEETTNSHFSADFIAQNGNLLPPTVPPVSRVRIMLSIRNEWFRLRLHRLAIDMSPVGTGFRLRLRLRRDRHSFARLRLAEEAEFIKWLVFRAQGAGGSLC